MTSLNLHQAYRLTQTLTVLSLMAVVWLTVQLHKPDTQFLYLNFGSDAQLVSVTPSLQTIKAGQSLRFNASWWLAKPLPENHAICYHVRNQNTQIGTLDTFAINSSGRKYSDISTNGEFFTNNITINLKKNAPPGIYEVVTFIYPTENFSLAPEFGSAIYNAQRTIFIVEVKP